MSRGALALVLLLFALAAPAHAASLSVGVAKVSVTPAPTDYPFKPSQARSLNTVPGERDFVGTHDPVFARAIVLSQGGRRIAIVSVEVTALPDAPHITAAIATALRIPAKDVLVAATHTHSVPLFSYAGHGPSPAESREIARLEAGAVAAAREAAARLAPARVAFARGEAWVNINNGEQVGSKAGYDPHGPSDKSLAVVRFTTLAGAPIALMVNYASHAEVMFRSVTKDGGYEVSGDLPGAVSAMLEASPQGAPLVLFIAGAEADQLTLFKSLQRGGPLPPGDEGAAGWALLDVQARRLAGSVLGIVAAIPKGSGEATLGTAGGEVTCPGQRIRFGDGGRVIAEAEPPVTIPLAMVRIGDILLAGVGGDVASEIGGNIRAALPGSTIVVSMAGASAGYIFADSSYARPGHGLSKSLLAPGCADNAISTGLKRLAGEAW